MHITNVNEYLCQGQPELGAVQTLSGLDVVQLNRLYNCPGSGVQGQLKVNIERAENIQPSPQSHIFVEVTAYDDKGASQMLTTIPILDPVWNQELDFGNRTLAVHQSSCSTI